MLCPTDDLTRWRPWRTWLCTVPHGVCAAEADVATVSTGDGVLEAISGPVH